MAEYEQAMEKATIISIPSPCTEPWEQMTTVIGGRHCAACQKTVQDFSTFSDRELANWLATYTGEATCGRLHVDQLERSIRPVQVRSEQPGHGSWVRWAVALVLGWQTAKGQTVPPQTPRSPTSLSPLQARTKLVTDYHEPALFYVTGRILNEDSLPLKSVTVRSELSGSSVMADQDGYFQLPIYKSDQVKDSLWLTVERSDRRHTHYVKVSTQPKQAPLLIIMYPPTPSRVIVSGGLAIVRQEPTKRRSFWQFLSGKK